MKVLVAAAEYSPLVRTGGLGNAVAGISEGLARRGHDVTVAIPGYEAVLPGATRGGSWVSLTKDPVQVMAWDGPGFDRPGVYGPDPGTGYEDNWSRYGAFSMAVAAAAPDYDVVHLHDAHVGLVPAASPMPAVLTIHNASHQMLGPLDGVTALVEGSTSLGSDLEWYGSASFLKVGLVRAARVTTVSPGHAAELTVEETSFGLAGVVNHLAHPIVGILNGIDTVSWDPRTDPTLPQNFSADDLPTRAANWVALLDRAGLDEGIVFGNVGRMARQKGLDLLDPVLGELISEGFRLVLVGNGELDDLVDSWVSAHPRAVAHFPYEEDLSRLVSAGCDSYLMPSEFEPSGLGQMYAMRYGAPPVVRMIGGLRDSVVDIAADAHRATGFGFTKYDAASLAGAIRVAMRTLEEAPDAWRRLQVNGMTTDWSWDGRAVEYEAVLEAAAAD
jgi:starch synthase